MTPSLFFCGRMYAGKTTAALAFVAPTIPHLNFADAVKASAARILGISVADVESRKGELRHFLQTIGHEARRVNQSVWIDQFDTARAGQTIVCSDVRYPNEADYAQSIGGVIILVETPGHERQARALAITGRYVAPAELAHPSETFLDTMPYHFAIPGTLSRAATIAAVLDGLKTKRSNDVYHVEN